MAAGVIVLLGARPGWGQAKPDPPAVLLDTTYTANQGRVIAVATGGDIQAALERARPGDTVTLEAGASFAGPVTLPSKTGSGWIIVRSSAPDSALPAPGERVTPAHATALAKIVARAGTAAVQAAPGAHHFRLVGLEVVGAREGVTYSVIDLGERASDPARLPHDIVIDRCYVHGDSARGARRGIFLNSKSTAVVDSYVADIKEAGADSQAISGAWGPGPFKIVDNYLEASGENLMFGGSDPTIAGLVPSDIEIRGNHLAKPLRWRQGDPGYDGSRWTVKNLLELKNARRVLIEGNLLEHSWAQAQAGFAVVITVRNQDGRAPWSDVSHVTFRRNRICHAASGFSIHGSDSDYPSQPSRRILIQDNVLEDIDGPRWGGSGRLLQIGRGPEDLVVEHNTAFNSGTIIAADGAPSRGFVFRDNIVKHGAYGVFGTDMQLGNPSLRRYFPGAIFEHNLLIGPFPVPSGRIAAMYSDVPDNAFPPSLEAVGFADPAAGNWALGPGSRYAHSASDGRDPGADAAALAALPCR